MDTEKAHEEVVENEAVEPEKPKTFADMTPEQVMSWLGRINKEQITKQFDEKVLPALQKLEGGKAQYPPSDDLQDLMFNNPKEFFRKGLEIVRQEDQNMTEAKTKALDEALMEYSEDPLYKEIHASMKQIATEKLRVGWPPKAAAEFAKTAAEKEHLSGLSRDDRLGMLDGGTKPSGKKKGSLPPNLKAACERDVLDGIVKDEEDFIKHMSPKLREIYGV